MTETLQKCLSIDKNRQNNIFQFLFPNFFLRFFNIFKFLMLNDFFFRAIDKITAIFFGIAKFSHMFLLLPIIFYPRIFKL